MTRYTKYKKKFNNESIISTKLSKRDAKEATAEPENNSSLTPSERAQIQADKQQDLQKLRMTSRQTSKPVCLNCRSRYHTVATCPKLKSKQICYNCGQADHRLQDCRRPRGGKNLAFATCFICGEQGHISRDCAKNENGIYPNGGGCRFCGSKQHLARDCRPDGKNSGNSNFDSSVQVDVSLDPKAESPDGDLVFDGLKKINSERISKRKVRKGTSSTLKDLPKVVKF